MPERAQSSNAGEGAGVAGAGAVATANPTQFSPTDATANACPASERIRRSHVDRHAALSELLSLLSLSDSASRLRPQRSDRLRASTVDVRVATQTHVNVQLAFSSRRGARALVLLIVTTDVGRLVGAAALDLDLTLTLSSLPSPLLVLSITLRVHADAYDWGITSELSYIILTWLHTHAILHLRLRVNARQNKT
jgi:hypothetical protein